MVFGKKVQISKKTTTTTINVEDKYYVGRARYSTFLTTIFIFEWQNLSMLYAIVGIFMPFAA